MIWDLIQDLLSKDLRFAHHLENIQHQQQQHQHPADVTPS